MNAIPDLDQLFGVLAWPSGHHPKLDKRWRLFSITASLRSRAGGARGKPEYRYEIVLYWSETDQAFNAEVPELPGCAADGPTYREALENAEAVFRSEAG